MVTNSNNDHLSFFTETQLELREELIILRQVAAEKEQDDAENNALRKKEKENTAVIQQLMSDIENLKKSGAAPDQMPSTQDKSDEHARELENLRSELEEMHGEQIVMMKEQVREQMQGQIDEVKKRLEEVLKEKTELEELKNKEGTPTVDSEEMKKGEVENPEKIKHLEETLATMEETHKQQMSQMTEHMQNQMDVWTKQLEAVHLEKQALEESAKAPSESDLEKQLNEVIVAKEQLNAENEQLKKKDEETKAVIEQLNVEIGQLKSASDDTQKQAEDFEKMRAQMEETHGEQISAIKSHFQEEISRLNQELSSSCSSKEETEALNAALSESINLMQSSVKDLQNQIDAVAAKKDKLNQKIEELTTENESLKEKELLEMSQVEGYKTEIEQLRNELQKKNEDDHKKIEQQQKVLENEIREQIQKQEKSEVENLQKHLDEIKAEKENLEEKLSQSMSESRKDDLDEIVSAKVQSLQAELKDAHNKQLGDLKGALHRQIVELQQQLLKFQAEKDELSKMIEQKDEVHKKEKEELVQQAKQWQDWGNNASEKENTNQKLKNNIKQLREQIMQYRYEYSTFGNVCLVFILALIGDYHKTPSKSSLVLASFIDLKTLQ